MKFQKYITLFLFIFVQVFGYGQKENTVLGSSTMPSPISYTSDFEQLFTKAEITQLDSLIVYFQHRTNHQIALVTLGELQCNKENFNDYTLALANTWGVGQKEKDNGILIAISRQFRQMRIQNGNGIKHILSDDETKQIIDTAFIPNFKNGNYFEGTKTGLAALMKALEEKQNKGILAKQFSETLITLIEHKKIKELMLLTLPKIYCYPCIEDITKKEPIVKKRNFYNKHLKSIFTNDLINRLKRYESFVYHGLHKNNYGDWGVFYTIYRKNEFGDGHEGAQFMFWFKEDTGKLQLSGIEMIP